MCKYFHLQASYGCSVYMYAREARYLCCELKLRAQAFVPATYQSAAEKELTSDAIHTSATHTVLVRDITDTNCQTMWRFSQLFFPCIYSLYFRNFQVSFLKGGS